MKSLGAAAAKDWEGAEDESGPTKNEERSKKGDGRRAKKQERREKREKNRGREMEDAFLETPDERRMTTKMHRKGG